MDLGWSPAFQQFVELVLRIAAILLVAASGLALAYLQKLTKKVSDETLRASLDAALTEARQVAKDAVLETKQVLVDDLKAKTTDGKLSKDEQAQAMGHALEYFRSHLSQNTLRILTAALGPVEQWATGLMEAQLAEVKLLEKAVGLPNSKSQG